MADSCSEWSYSVQRLRTPFYSTAGFGIVGHRQESPQGAYVTRTGPQ